MKRTHATPLRPGDRVAPLYEGTLDFATATFVEYCRGYLSHCVVQVDGEAQPRRIACYKLRLQARGDDVV